MSFFSMNFLIARCSIDAYLNSSLHSLQCRSACTWMTLSVKTFQAGFSHDNVLLTFSFASDSGIFTMSAVIRPHTGAWKKSILFASTEDLIQENRTSSLTIECWGHRLSSCKGKAQQHDIGTVSVAHVHDRTTSKTSMVPPSPSLPPFPPSLSLPPSLNKPSS